MHPCSAFGIPSYHVQQMLSQHLGTALLPTAVERGGEVLEASATCQDDSCRKVGHQAGGRRIPG
jgi:hypothetical protein